MDIKHVIVLMLENRSFDCMLGMLYPSDDKFDGITGTESNAWHKPDGSEQNIQVWKDPALDAKTVCIPDPDPGELFTDIHMQIHGLAANGMPNTANNDGLPFVVAPAVPPAPPQVARAAAKSPNSLQKSLSTAALQLPTAGADIATHIQRLRVVPDVEPQHATVADAAVDVAAHVKAFLGRP